MAGKEGEAGTDPEAKRQHVTSFRGKSQTRNILIAAAAMLVIGVVVTTVSAVLLTRPESIAVNPRALTALRGLLAPIVVPAYRLTALPRTGSPSGLRPSGDPTHGRAGTSGDTEYTVLQTSLPGIYITRRNYIALYETEDALGSQSYISLSSEVTQGDWRKTDAPQVTCCLSCIFFRSIVSHQAISILPLLHIENHTHSPTVGRQDVTIIRASGTLRSSHGVTMACGRAGDTFVIKIPEEERLTGPGEDVEPDDSLESPLGRKLREYRLLVGVVAFLLVVDVISISVPLVVNTRGERWHPGTLVKVLTTHGKNKITFPPNHVVDSEPYWRFAVCKIVHIEGVKGRCDKRQESIDGRPYLQQISVDKTVVVFSLDPDYA
ncbi:hypothetical protein Bbelb_196640 [Branchiostoma belcheri]|nr:hypothetical protein Bbelb_196640 [Branchiostoma belcheri]